MSQRAPMNEEKKKAANEKRKATLKAKKMEQEKKRVDDMRNAAVIELRANLERDIETKKQNMDDEQARLNEERSRAERKAAMRRRLYDKYSMAMTEAGLDISFIASMLQSSIVGHVSVHLLRPAKHEDTYIAKLTQTLESIQGVSKVSITRSHGKSSHGHPPFGDERYLLVTFTLDTD